jgi:hypothetical protein
LAQSSVALMSDYIERQYHSIFVVLNMNLVVVHETNSDNQYDYIEWYFDMIVDILFVGYSNKQIFGVCC